MKILFIHGWFHSAKIYEKLAKTLDCEESVLIDLPGFGDNEYTEDIEEIENEHIKYVRKILSENNFDVVISHSYGSRILLKSLEQKQEFSKIKCILLNPAYSKNKVLKNVANKEKFVYPLFKLINDAPKKITNIPIKIGCLLTINKWKYIDEIVLESVYKSDPRVATKVLDILATTEFCTDENRIKNDIYLIYSKKDRAISSECFQSLIDDLKPEVYVFEKSGHTLVLEDFSGLTKVIQNIIN